MIVFFFPFFFFCILFRCIMIGKELEWKGSLEDALLYLVLQRMERRGVIEQWVIKSAKTSRSDQTLEIYTNRVGIFYERM